MAAAHKTRGLTRGGMLSGGRSSRGEGKQIVWGGVEVGAQHAPLQDGRGGGGGTRVMRGGLCDGIVRVDACRP